ncbi:hypothetical protein Trydic_g3749 [Trypoxylus dichotomus]
MFGHTQSNCNINYKCMKYGEDHSTHLCEKPKTTPPKCANCGGEHLSTYLKCPENPNNAIGKKYIDAPLPKNNPWNKKKDNGPSNTQPPKEEPKKTTNSKTEDKLALILGRMLLNFNNTNATVEQRMEFLRQTEELTALYENQEFANYFESTFMPNKPASNDLEKFAEAIHGLARIEYDDELEPPETNTEELLGIRSRSLKLSVIQG